MNKTKILFLYSSKGFGGIVRNLSMLVNGLDKEKFNITVVSLANEGDPHSDIKLQENTGIEFIKILERKKLDTKAISKIRDLINKRGIDIISCHGYKADIYGVFLAKIYNCKVKLVTMKHGWVTPGIKFQIYYFLDKLATRWFDKAVLVAEGQRQEIIGFGIPRLKIEVINNAIDPLNFEIGGYRHTARKEFHLNEEDYAIGFAGRLSAEKDIETILRAGKEMLKSGKRIKILIAGEGPQENILKKISKNLAIEENVIFAGHVKDIKKVYSAIDLYVSTSLAEGLPNNLLEAQSAGIPCVATDISGNSDIIEDGVNGFLIKKKDYKTLAKKILTLAENRELAAKFTAEGKRIIKDKFSLQKRIEKLENLYSGLIEGAK